jgi:hypothetical protein
MAGPLVVVVVVVEIVIIIVVVVLERCERGLTRERCCTGNPRLRPPRRISGSALSRVPSSCAITPDYSHDLAREAASNPDQTDADGDGRGDACRASARTGPTTTTTAWWTIRTTRTARARATTTSGLPHGRVGWASSRRCCCRGPSLYAAGEDVEGEAAGRRGAIESLIQDGEIDA